MRKLTLACSLILGTLTSAAYAADSIEIQNITMTGNGCDNFQDQAVFSPENQLSVLFNNYIAEAGNGSATIVRKNCNLVVPVTVPAGFAVGIQEVNIHGYASVTMPNTYVLFDSEIFFSGRPGPKLTKKFSMNYVDVFSINLNSSPNSTIWSACGVNTNLRINTTLKAKTNVNGDAVYGVIGGSGHPSDLTLKLAWKRC